MVLALPTQAQHLFSDLDYGVYPVGFTHYVAIDSTRQYQRIHDFTDSKIYRPIPISVWYPAKEQTADQRLTVDDYLRIVAEEAEWENLPDDLMLGWFGYGTDSVYQTRRKLKTKAVRSLPYIDDSHPLIVYSPGYERSSVENFALSEYLASHGYVVISSPSRGTGQQFLDAGTFRDIETQTRDFEFLAKEVRSRYAAGQLRSVTALGYSFGGLAGVYAATRNDYVNAVISLDGAIKYQYEKLKQSPYFDAVDFKVAMVHISQKDIPTELLDAEDLPPSINTEFEFFDEIGKVHAYKIRMDSLSHSYFTSLGVLFQPRDPRQDPAWRTIRTGYQTLCRLSLKSLNAVLTQPSALYEQIESGHLANPEDFTLLEYKQAAIDNTPTMNFREWVELMRAYNYQDLAGLNSEYSHFRDMPTSLYSPKEWELNTLALKLAFDPETYEAGIRVAEFATLAYPESANLYDTLGEIYLLDNRKEKAILNFKKSLDIYPENGNAIKRLKELKVD
ncbi:alpha/beta hydrolase [Lewinellaceae bacterium SD302]|nr:alpha/beta hydrolase [Lewinellaceae bacterium SD302]